VVWAESNLSHYGKFGTESFADRIVGLWQQLPIQRLCVAPSARKGDVVFRILVLETQHDFFVEAGWSKVKIVRLGF